MKQLLSTLMQALANGELELIMTTADAISARLERGETVLAEDFEVLNDTDIMRTMIVAALLITVKQYIFEVQHIQRQAQFAQDEEAF